MKCPKCGAEIPVGSKVCEYCRAQITYEMQREQEQLESVESTVTMETIVEVETGLIA